MNWWSLTLLALAVSLDGLWSGLAFGLRGIRISSFALFIIAVISGSAALLTLGVGTVLAGAFPRGAARILGGAVMVGLGIWAVHRAYQDGYSDQRHAASGDENDSQSEAAPAPLTPLTRLRRWLVESKAFIKRLMRVLRDPAAADADFSGVISIPEALVLALAVSLDGALAGFGAGLSGFHALATPALIGFFQSGLQWFGNLVAASLPAALREGHRFHYLPGAILIVVGFLRLI